ncbi:tRNA (N(6)-L-threonylcarbamoyladenosine(37)-C(2))-methylthiotransferase MtaB [bacterium]|nr:tRNA (N(6)-L-threonylcarbamoyladenosine(37)-C(2))-methylthiotransferase MtaB [bacterium]NIN92548.1 tRNA (N(6)-L-threonylcarbamoyladenosine(37)-C(2))-methylthiotransferase MtaB [bacterium]NIO18590.1 tRNA (N(6)-L-threonylcarbamoyladenosine(37)-C(2))-methylthiotransferase MtaB [bacterium]NIO73605.1 tRNA (N(6)-L-threonylcarbamoyladenosine(37)-C(2))-methylthiotransferase MtaB [bacterium]
MRRKSVATYTLGCKVNQYETALIEEELTERGLRIVPFSQDADYYLINTCTVTLRTDQKCREYIRSALKRNRKAKVVVTGCYAQRSPQELKKISPQCQVFDNSQKRHIAGCLAKEVFAIRETEESHGKLRFISRFPQHTRAFVKIQDGCKSFCSYCIIPYVRKEVSSRPLSEVLSEVNILVDSGYKEIVLCGINLGNYQKLVPLLEKLNSLTGLERIRISSIEPLHINQGLIAAMKSFSKMCHHLHIPLQSGDDHVLKIMNRKYTTGDYQKIIEMVRKSIPDVGISTDLIVGFPGETERRFYNTYDFVNKMGFSKMHIFRFSPRPGTVASRLPGRVSPSEMRRRSRTLDNLEKELREKFYRQYLNKELVVLFERKVQGKRENGRVFHSGFSSNYIRVLAPASEDELNRLVSVRIDDVNYRFAIGEILH